MRHTKEIKRQDGSKVRITVEIRIDYGHWKYVFMVDACEPMKGTWRSTVNHVDYSWRCLSGPEREAEDTRRKLLYVTVDEVQKVALELWQHLRPDLSADRGQFRPVSE